MSPRGGSLVRSLGLSRVRIILNRAVTDQSHSDITGLLFALVFLETEFICKFSASNAESGIKQGWVSSGCLRMHRGCWKTYTSHVKGKDVFRSSPFTTPNGLYRVVSSKSRQFTGSARRVGVRYLHTPYQFYQSFIPHSTNSRHISWSFKSQPRPTGGSNEVPDNEEDAARIAILNKVMKGRQPTDLILRCK